MVSRNRKSPGTKLEIQDLTCDVKKELSIYGSGSYLSPYPILEQGLIGSYLQVPMAKALSRWPRLSKVKMCPDG